MRIVILSPSVYSEAACAMAVRMARLGQIPVGALSLRSTNRRTLLRKVRQWGVREVARYARMKVLPHRGEDQSLLRNAYLLPFLRSEKGVYRTLREVAQVYNFPVVTCANQNAPNAIARIRKWSPDLIIFAGGNILRKPLLDIPRLFVLNVHLGVLPQVRGMSSPEWSLLKNVSVGVTIHSMDTGIDTGPILQKYEFSEAGQCGSLSDLRNRLVAFGVERLGDVVKALQDGTITAETQPDLDRDHQFFVMHEWLQERAAEQLAQARATFAGTSHG